MNFAAFLGSAEYLVTCKAKSMKVLLVQEVVLRFECFYEAFFSVYGIRLL